jgi:hypothetical protein
MTPINLLTKGQTIRGMTNTRSAYKLTRHALPRFGTSRIGPLRIEMEPPQQPLFVPLIVVEPEPVKETPAPEPAPVKPVKIAACQPVGSPLDKLSGPIKAGATRVWNFWKRATPKSEVVQAPPRLAEPSAPPPTPAAVEAKAGIWRLLLQRITFRRRVVKVRGVQTELALERVAVIRNDLSDADLEVIPRMDAKKRESNPFRSSAKAWRVKQTEEERKAAPAFAPLCAATEAQPTE